MAAEQQGKYFALFNEIGIIAQLNRAALDKQLPGDLISPHFTVLNHLVRVQDGQSQQQLASAFQVAKTTMSHTISGLVKHKLVELRANPADGRSKCVWLTAKGHQLREQTISDVSPGVATALEGLSESDINEMIGKLARIREILDSARSA